MLVEGKQPGVSTMIRGPAHIKQLFCLASAIITTAMESSFVSKEITLRFTSAALNDRSLKDVATIYKNILRVAEVGQDSLLEIVAPLIFLKCG